MGLTILTALANLLPTLSEDEAYLALFPGRAVWRRTATGSRCAGSARPWKAAGTGLLKGGCLAGQ